MKKVNMILSFSIYWNEEYIHVIYKFWKKSAKWYIMWNKTLLNDYKTIKVYHQAKSEKTWCRLSL
jgi:hypothetical protein